MLQSKAPKSSQVKPSLTWSSRTGGKGCIVDPPLLGMDGVAISMGLYHLKPRNKWPKINGFALVVTGHLFSRSGSRGQPCRWMEGDVCFFCWMPILMKMHEHANF